MTNVVQDIQTFQATVATWNAILNGPAAGAGSAVPTDADPNQRTVAKLFADLTAGGAAAVIAGGAVVPGALVMQGAVGAQPNVLRTEAQAVFQGATGDGGWSAEATGDCVTGSHESYGVFGITCPSSASVQKGGSISCKGVQTAVGIFAGHMRWTVCYNLDGTPANQLDSIVGHLFKDSIVLGVSADASAISAATANTLVSAWKATFYNDGSAVSGAFASNFSILDSTKSKGPIFGYLSSGNVAVSSHQGVSGRLAHWSHNGTAWAERYGCSFGGKFLAGTDSETHSSNAHHFITANANNVGNPVAVFGGNNGGGVYYSGFFLNVSGGGWNNANAAFVLGKDATTSRSLNAAGTVGTSGADYAEFETKADGCDTVAKGQVIGFDADGKITDKWEAAIGGFGIKSTNPSFVGGDAHATEEAIGMVRPVMPTAPQQPNLPAEPNYPQPPAPPTEESADAQAVYLARLTYHESEIARLRTEHANNVAAYEAALAAYGEEVVADMAAMAQHDADLGKFVALVEAARAPVDRIAYSGKVPVRVMGAKPGDYIVAVQDGDGIGGRIVTAAEMKADMTLYLTAVGRVRRVIDAAASASLAKAISNEKRPVDPDCFQGWAEVAVIIH